MHRLYRHPTDKVIGGVAAGVGVWLNIDPTIVRIAWVLLAFFTGGIFLVLYIVMLVIVPLAPADWVAAQAAGPARGSNTGPAAGPGPQPAPNPCGPYADGPNAGWQATPPSSPDWAPPSIGNGNAGIVGGVILVLLGVWFLVDQFLDIDWSLLWPVFVIAAGVALIVVATRRTRAG